MNEWLSKWKESLKLRQEKVLKKEPSFTLNYANLSFRSASGKTESARTNISIKILISKTLFSFQQRPNEGYC